MVFTSCLSALEVLLSSVNECRKSELVQRDLNEQMRREDQ